MRGFGIRSIIRARFHYIGRWNNRSCSGPTRTPVDAALDPHRPRVIGLGGGPANHRAIREYKRLGTNGTDQASGQVLSRGPGFALVVAVLSGCGPSVRAGTKLVV